MSIADDLITIRILKRLTTPFEKMEAFKLGIIDAKGKKIRDPKTPQEKESYDLLWRLVIRLKIVLNLIPIGNKSFLSYAAAYALIRECVNESKEPNDLEIMFTEAVLNETYKYQDINLFDLDFKSLSEEGIGGVAPAAPGIAPAADVPTNSTKNIAGTITGVNKKSKMRYFRRSKVNI